MFIALCLTEGSVLEYARFCRSADESENIVLPVLSNSLSRQRTLSVHRTIWQGASVAEPNGGIPREDLQLRRMQVDGHTLNAAADDVSTSLPNTRSLLPTLDPKAGPDRLRIRLRRRLAMEFRSSELAVCVVPDRARRLRNPCHEHAVFAWSLAMAIA